MPQQLFDNQLFQTMNKTAFFISILFLTSSCAVKPVQSVPVASVEEESVAPVVAPTPLLNKAEPVVVERTKEAVAMYVCDPKDPAANIRKSPDGEVVTQLANDAMIEIDRMQGNWCHIASNRYVGEEGSNKIAETEGDLWIHASCLGCDFVGGEGTEIITYSAPSESATQKVEKVRGSFHPATLEAKQGAWVKVKLRNGQSVWVTSDSICGNPYTSCS